MRGAASGTLDVVAEVMLDNGLVSDFAIAIHHLSGPSIRLIGIVHILTPACSLRL